MDDLKAYYRGSLKNRIETLETVKENLTHNDLEAQESIRRIAHSLSGAGATYGFPEISTAAEALLASSPEHLPAATEALIETLRTVALSAPDIAATILIVEDEPGMSHILEAKLAGPNRNVVLAQTSADATEILERTEIDLLLLDLGLPDEDGRNLLARLRGNPKYTATPIVVVSGRSGSQAKAECYALGADEFFDKPVDLEALSAAVATKLLRAGEVSLEARHDPLTGLLNRAGVSIAFERALALAQRAGYPLSLALVDLDGLKRINDTHGHAFGDEVLRRVARILTTSLRRSDRVARWGGDEFVILFPNGTPSGATFALDKARRTLGEEIFEDIDQPLRIRLSAGVTAIERGACLEDVVARADLLLYRAKSAGGNRVLTADRRPVAANKRVLLAEGNLETAERIAERLREADLDVVSCVDGTTALEAAFVDDIDLAILDMKIPGGGLELLQRLRKTAAHAETPIILLSGTDSEQEVLAAFDLGADDYVVKPISPLEIRARARRLLKSMPRRG